MNDCCTNGVCNNHTKDHALFCSGRCHRVGCEFNIQRSGEAAQEPPKETIWEEFDSYFEGSYGTGFPVMKHRIKTWLKSTIQREVERERNTIREICNRCKTERGLARALANHLGAKRPHKDK